MTKEQVEIRAKHLKEFFAQLEKDAQSGEFEIKYSSHLKNLFYELLEKAHDYTEEIVDEFYEQMMGQNKR